MTINIDLKDDKLHFCLIKEETIELIVEYKKRIFSEPKIKSIYLILDKNTYRIKNINKQTDLMLTDYKKRFGSGWSIGKVTYNSKLNNYIYRVNIPKLSKKITVVNTNFKQITLRFE